MSNYELPLTISVSLQRGSEIRGAPNQQNRRRHLMEQALQYAMRSQSASCPPLQQAIVILSLRARERLGEKGGAFLKGKEGRDGPPLFFLPSGNEANSTLLPKIVYVFSRNITVFEIILLPSQP